LLNGIMEAAMKKNHYRLRTKIHLLLWTGITLVSIYLLLRFAALSLLENRGQADVSMKDFAFSTLLDKVMEASSSMVDYQNEELAYAFPASLAEKQFALGEYIMDDTYLVKKVNNFNSLPSYATGVKSDEENFNSNDNTDNKDNQDKDDADSVGIGYNNEMQDYLSKEYILSNGAVFASMSGKLQIGYMEGDVKYESEDTAKSDQAVTVEARNTGNLVDYTMEQLKDVNFLIRHFYIVDPSTKITDDLFNAEALLGKDMTIKQSNEAPQILIYHTHSQETYIDSREKVSEDTVVGVGSYLAKILEDEYGYNVIHDTTCYDIVDGRLDRNVAYSMAEAGIGKILKENPSIEVVIDLHRDATEKRSTEIEGKETAQIMLFNGLSRDQNGPIDYLDNPNLQDNLAFSLQLQLKSLKLYPGLFYRNFLKSYRYNMHVRKKCILMELGTYKNTLQSAKNAMDPFAEILDAVLQGE